MSPLSPGLLFRPTRGGEGRSPPAEGILLPTALDDFDDSVLGDLITYTRCEHFPGSESPLSLPVYAWPSDSACLLDPTVLQIVLTSGTSSLPRCSSSRFGGRPVVTSQDCRVVHTDSRGPEACHFRMGIQRMACSFIILGFWSSPTFWVDQLGKEKALAWAVTLQRDVGVMLSNLQILSQFATALHRMSFSMMALGIEQSLFPRAEVDVLSPAPRAARAASYLSAMGLWHPQTGPGDPGPVPVSSCRSCMNCEYCFPEDQLPPGYSFLCVFLFFMISQPVG